MTTKNDNGGAIAIKGFNYQKASIILVMIMHYRNDEFFIIPEAEDDFQVHMNGKNMYIQVKGEKSITLTKLLNKDIIEKNLVVGNEADSRKIFVWDISRTLMEKLEVSKKSALVNPLLKYSEETSKSIVNKLNLNKSNQARLSNQYLFLTPFKNNIEDAIKYLYGEMINQNLYISQERGRLLLGELTFMIDRKSEIIVNDGNYEEKIIDKNYLKNIFICAERIELFKVILEKLGYNEMKKTKIIQERMKILTGYETLKMKTKTNCDVLDLENSTEEMLIAEIVNIIEKNDNTINDKNLKVAIAIECLCELWESNL